MTLYRITYDRDDKKAAKFRKAGVPYSEGEYRQIMLVADSEQEALEVAGKRLAKQYPSDRYEQSADGSKVRIDGAEFNGEHRPDLAHSNYKLQGVEVLKEEA